MKIFMKSLKEYIAEGLLDRVKNKEVNHEAIIKEFLKDNYKINGSYTIKGTKDGFVVDVKGYIKVINKDITSLTNGLFEFGEVSGEFLCYYCKNLTSLEGAPEKVGGTFECHNCKALTTLEGAPEKVGESFYCSECILLKTLKGAPKEVGGSFQSSNCGIEFTEEDVKKHTTVAKKIYI